MRVGWGEVGESTRVRLRRAGTLLAEVAQEEEEKAEAAADHGGGTSNTTS